MNFGQVQELKVGLIDGAEIAHEILKEKYGEDVVIKKFEKTKGWLSQNFHLQIILTNLQIF